jgi:hypothetical protein
LMIWNRSLTVKSTSTMDILNIFLMGWVHY